MIALLVFITLTLVMVAPFFLLKPSPLTEREVARINECNAWVAETKAKLDATQAKADALTAKAAVPAVPAVPTNWVTEARAQANAIQAEADALLSQEKADSFAAGDPFAECFAECPMLDLSPALYTPVELVDMTPRSGCYSIVPASYSKWVASPVRDAHAGLRGLR